MFLCMTNSYAIMQIRMHRNLPNLADLNQIVAGNGLIGFSLDTVLKIIFRVR